MSHCPLTFSSVPSRLFLLSLAILISACASVGAPETVSSEVPSLRVEPDGVKAWRANESLDQRALCIADIEVSFAPHVDLGVSDQAEFRTLVRASLSQKLALAGLPVSNGSCADTDLLLRSRITEVRRASPAANAITALLLFAPLSRGGLTIEFDAADVSGKHRFAALAVMARAGVEDIRAAFSELGHARRQIDVASERFARLIKGD